MKIFYLIENDGVLVMHDGKGRSLAAVLVLMAAIDEEEGIGHTLMDLKRYLRDPHILVVDGSSKDKTMQIAKSLGADVIYQVDSGKGDALRQGLQHIKEDVGYVVFTDADYTYPAVFIPRMIQILDENPQVGMVCGNRFNSHFDLRSMHSVFYIGNRALAFAHNMLNGIGLRDPLTGLRVVRWEILKDWKPKSDGFDFEVELNHRVERQGYEIVETPIFYRPRLGEKKLKLRHGFTILKRILTESMY